MTRLVPHPLLSLAILLMWLLLTRFSPGHLVLGTAIGLIAGQALATLHPQAPRLRRLDLVARLVGVVSVDIIRSNVAVAWLIATGGRNGARRSEFIEIPLELRNQGALALLAIILTATPGTAWLEYKPTQGTLLLHVFDLVDEATWRDLIKNRYEALLLEIFE
jgi:multicomponent K+:H+ antiporter subunit E